ncbi:hypothetical protein BDV98DRAFT_606489 [Pterulicium gracile]|uniref:Uncharacterized protein n=1 Tax=Pterulicium gracile TaxID=1884261 RepID=A0A5C3QAG8_9AGAR|nr:hypothetical protein BDV98DRAFT_606489 [Pterula gracilis]
MALRPPRFMPNLYTQHPNDNSDKSVQVQAFRTSAQEDFSNRHVLLQWTNARIGSGPDDDDTCKVIQMIQPTGGVGQFGTQDNDQATNSGTWGVFSRKQRDRILELAARVEFNKRSRVNSCRAWTRDLLVAMVEAGLVDPKVFEVVDGGVPLKKRAPE